MPGNIRQYGDANTARAAWPYVRPGRASARIAHRLFQRAQAFDRELRDRRQRTVLEGDDGDREAADRQFDRQRL
jgi:hypothetical protein